MIWFTVYLRATDEVIASGTGVQCARAMGMTYGSFYSTVSLTERGKRSKYLFYKENLKKEEIPQ